MNQGWEITSDSRKARQVPEALILPCRSGEMSQCGAALFQGALFRGEVAHLLGPQVNSAPGRGGGGASQTCRRSCEDRPEDWLNSSVSPSLSQDLLVPCSSLLGVDLSRRPVPVF